MDLSESKNLPAPPAATWSPHPLRPAQDREIIHVTLFPGETLEGYLARAGLLRRIRNRRVRLSINDAMVPRAMWKHSRPKPGTLIQIQAVVAGGGGDGKNPLKTVLMIALMVAAPYVAPWLGVTGVAASFVTAGVGIVGSMVINAIFPPPKPNMSKAQNGPGQESPTYALSGGGNRLRPYEPMPVIMGVHRIFPDGGARPYTEFEGEDQYLYQVFEFGYNDVELSDFRIGGTPIDQFGGVTLQESDETGALTLFPVNVDSLPGAALPATIGFIQRTGSPDATGLAIEIDGALLYITPAGDVVVRGVDVEIQYRLVGAGYWTPLEFTSDAAALITADSPDYYGHALVAAAQLAQSEEYGLVAGAGVIRILSASRKPLRRTFKWNVPVGHYEVQVRRVTPDETDPNAHSEIAWSQFRTYQADTADYTGRKRVALKIKASGQLNGQVDQLSAIARARCEVWDGADWVTAHTTNPAWWVLAAARGKYVGGRRMWGSGIPDGRIGLDNLIDFAAWCDAKALSFNGVFDQPMSMQDMLDAIALCGRGTVSNGAGKLEVVWDAPDQPVVAVIGMSNIKLDTFEIEYTTEQLADEFVLSFINPENDWQRDVVRQLAPGVTAPVRSRQLELFGCTDKDMAGRAANLYIATNEYRTRHYKWKMDWEAMPLSRGEVAQLSHDLASYDYSGRLIEGCTDTLLKIERRVPLADAGGYMTLVKPDGSFSTHAVQGGVGDTDTLTLITPLDFDPGDFPDHPPYDFRWLYGHRETPGRKIKIDAIRPLSYDTVELTAIDETSAFYDAEGDDYIYANTRRVFGAPQINNLQLTEDGVRAGTGYLANVTISWNPGGDYGFAEVRISINSGPLILYGETRGRGYDFTVSDGSPVVVELTAYSSIGRLGRFVRQTVSKTINFAVLNPPAHIASLGLSGGTFTYPPAPEVDVVGYQMRFHIGNRRIWEDALPLHTGLITESPYTPISLPAGLVSFGIKAIDAAGLESVEAAWVISNLGDPAVANVIEQIDLKALGWPGTITGGGIVVDEVVADNETAFYNSDPSAPFYGSPGSPFYPVSQYAAMAYETDRIVASSPLAGSRLTINIDLVGTPTFIEWRQTGPSPFYPENPADPFYGAPDDPFYDPPPEYSPWPGSIVIQHEPYQFRVRTGQGGTEGRIAAMVLEIDAPDIEETIDNLVISPGGTRLALAKSYSVIKNIQLTLEDDGGDAVSARWLDKSVALGPLIECIDENQSSVAGRLDARIKGY